MKQKTTNQPQKTNFRPAAELTGSHEDGASLAPPPLQFKRADPGKKWGVDQFFEEYQATPETASLSAEEQAHFKNYADRAQIYLSRPNMKWTDGVLTGQMFADAALQTYLKYGKDMSKVVPVEFALTQGQFESHLGVTGRSADKNPFNVGEYDSHTADWVSRIENPAQGIAMFYDLMAEDYLSVRTPEELLQEGNFVNETGNRYASNQNYEKDLRTQIGYVESYINKNGGQHSADNKTPAPTPASDRKQGTVTASKLNVRKGSSTDYDTVEQLSRGETVTVFSEKNGWFLIGKQRWVSARFIQVKAENNHSETTPENAVEYTTGGPDLDRNSGSRVHNRWINKGEDSAYTTAFNDTIENKIAAVFGEGYSRAKVLKEIADAEAQGNHDNAAELRAKLFTANIYNVVDTLDVENNSLYKKGGGKTYCNIYAYDVVTAMGGYLPRVWWTSAYEKEFVKAADKGLTYDKAVKYADTVREMNANSLTKWMAHIGKKYFGWEKAADMKTAQAAADSGQLVIILAANKVSTRSGHVNVILPQTEQRKAKTENNEFLPLQSQAGGSNFKHKAHYAWWKDANHKDGAAWIATGKADSPIMTPEELGVKIPAPEQTAENSDKIPGIKDKKAENQNEEKTSWWAETMDWLEEGVEDVTDFMADGWGDLTELFTFEKKDAEKAKVKDIPTAAGMVTATALNVRKNGNKNAEKNGTALNKGTKVLIYEEKNGWYRIGNQKWVSAKYILKSNSTGANTDVPA